MTEVVTREFKGVLVHQGNATQAQFHVREEDGKLSIMLADHTMSFDEAKPHFYHNAKVKITIEYEEAHKIDTSSHL